MNPRLSLHLDLMRALAALVVLASHFAYERFSGGALRELRDLNLGSDAVVVFFVLSGFVIAYAAETRDRTAARFLFNRATRLWTVAAPALLATMALDRTGALIAPQAYVQPWFNDLPAAQMLLSGLGFSNEWLGQGVRLGSNGPWWSLSYEAAYYLIFAAVFFLDGWRRWAIALALCILAGPRVLLLLPVWAMGVLAWRAIASGHVDGIGLATARLLAAAPLLLYPALLATDAPTQLSALTSALTGWSPAEIVVHLRFSDEALWNTVLGLLATSHVLGMARLTQRTAANPHPETNAGQRAIRYVAGASFSVYLLHYPLMQFLHVALAGLPEPLRAASILVLTLAGCFAFAALFERPLAQWRELVFSMGPAGLRRACGAAIT
ncbi:MAG TPA: acyltransferase [Rhizobiaceae bacterium]|nr:acyltransferase [Rhizobiaceae bacterium]